MTKINRKVEYALIALKHLGTQPPGAIISANEIASKYQMPAELTARVLQTLARAHLLRSVSGVHGGYQVTSDLGELTLLDLLNVLEGPTEIARCLHSSEAGMCDVFASCNIIAPVQHLNQRLNEFYRSVRLSDLLGLHSVHAPDRSSSLSEALV